MEKEIFLWRGPSGTEYEVRPSGGCAACALDHSDLDCDLAPCGVTGSLHVIAQADSDRIDAERYRKLRDSGRFIPTIGRVGWTSGDGAAVSAAELDAAVDLMGC